MKKNRKKNSENAKNLFKFKKGQIVLIASKRYLKSEKTAISLS